MDKKSLQNKVKRLREQIDELRYGYHVENNPEITDKMYEGLMDQLRKIENEYPDLITPYSPTQRVAGSPLEKFKKVEHVVPQWSFNDAFCEKDLRDWEERIFKICEKKFGKRPDDLDYICELKIDGLHIVLTYENGKLRVAATRGDGKVGEDVTQNVRTINSVPIKLKKNIDIIVEGEIWIDDKIFSEINKQRKKDGLSLYANPRNLAAGTIRQLDPKIVAERKLSLTAYDISRGDIPATQAEELEELKNLGFHTDGNWKICKTIDDIIKFWKFWGKRKRSRPFWLDGIVVKVNKKKYQDALGFTGKAPRWAIAFKFPAEQGTTKIIDIYAQVGRSGILTPVALMEPVLLAGTTVTHATLHNFEEIRRLGVRIGDTVVIEKAGDIIPKVVKVLEKLRTGNEKKVKAPVKCPICGSRVERRVIGGKNKKGSDTSAGLFCVNSKCYAQELRKIIHFVSKKAYDIEGLGSKIIGQLVDEGLVKNVADIFTLKKGDLEILDRFAEKSADNLIAAIEKAKMITLPRFIFGLGIKHIGEDAAARLADYFRTLDNVMRADINDLEKISSIGPNAAKAVYEYFNNKENLNLIKNLLNNGVEIKAHNPTAKNGKFKGKIFVFTGTLDSLTREETKRIVQNLGGRVTGSVNKSTDYLVAGKNPGSKLEKAKRMDIKILSEKQFLHMV